ncbi:biotin--[acetyl-CoA-carboxylase] ligase [Agromyces archimandritae]|uniref:biotin--[biotin carboxyl-carrier protein] ligase n=1 Tax=Agromyces archimandritae TaxID=2781962 RepID=A0A975FQE2_9MICO|nr:biotin--[acetyl-CoA-carboxylase] ligase [Agromyces archimandritae]QTX05296.1 biotin--[acetyl-CoA-carboxylase] ligase [Agromyces archimandritae]
MQEPYGGFERSRREASRFEWRDEATSTNTELSALASGADAGAWPDGAVLVTDRQTAGRGRLGRRWLAPTGKTLAISVLLRPPASLPLDAYGWLPLLAGAAMTDAVRGAVDAALARTGAADDADAAAGLAPGAVETWLKWPNDVLVSGYKVCGILSELLPDARSVVVGAGLNLTLDEHDLPTLTSTSLLLATGVAPDADAVLADYLRGFRALVARLAEAGGDAIGSGLAADVVERCGTIGGGVRVELPDGTTLEGMAEGLDESGRILVRTRENDALQAVAAGDVTHLRYE